VTSRIETIGSSIEARHATKFGDSPDYCDAVATGGLRRRTAIKMAHEGLELAPQRRIVPDAGGPIPIVGTDLNQSVPITIENRNGGFENDLYSTPMLGAPRGDLEHAQRISSEMRGHSPHAIGSALSDCVDRGRNNAQDFEHDGEIVR
jgi:hypothetical protein